MAPSLFPRASSSKSACILKSAYMRFSLRFSSSIAFIWLTMDASVTRQAIAQQSAERACHHTSPAICRKTHCSCHVHGKAPPPARRLRPDAGSPLLADCYAIACRAMDDLRLSVSACLHSESPRLSCRENSTYAAPYFRVGMHTSRTRLAASQKRRRTGRIG